MSHTPIVTVRGNATFFVPPDEAALYWSTDTHQSSAEAARSAVADRLAAARRVLADFTVLRVTDGVRVGPRTRWVKGRSLPDGFSGHADLNIVLSEFDNLGELVARLGDLPEATVSGPNWSVRPDNRAHTETRLAAIHDARVVARDYAAAFGVELTSLIEVTDQVAEPVGMNAAYAGKLTRGGVAEESSLALEPAEQEISAQVVVRFGVGEPTREALG